MNTEKLTYLLKHPNLIEATDNNELEKIIKAYPYFQAPRAIRLKALKDNGSFLYNQKLKETAAYTPDRDLLFQFITSKKFKDSTLPTEVVTHDIEEVTIPSIPDNEFVISPQEATQITDSKLFTPTKEEIVSTVVPQKPIPFTENEKHSFIEWLKLTKLQPIERDEKPQKRKLIDNPLIDSFIRKNPKIPPVKKSTSTVNLAKQNSTYSDNLTTETLAKVYIAQGNYKKAIKAYKILSLKNPEKSGLFADQIRAIKKLQENK